MHLLNIFKGKFKQGLTYNLTVQAYKLPCNCNLFIFHFYLTVLQNVNFHSQTCQTCSLAPKT